MCEIKKGKSVEDLYGPEQNEKDKKQYQGSANTKVIKFPNPT